MGGHNIADILEANKGVISNKYLLQPNYDWDFLKMWLDKNNYLLESTNLIQDRTKSYFIYIVSNNLSK
jgi:tRNA A22 N-methylase